MSAWIFVLKSSRSVFPAAGVGNTMASKQCPSRWARRALYPASRRSVAVIALALALANAAAFDLVLP